MKLRHEISQYLAEFIGTFFLVLFGCGSVVVAQTNPEALNTSLIPFVFGGTVSIMIYAVGHISGAHFNPCVTVAFWASKRFPTFRVVGYVLSQIGGAILASLLLKLAFESGHDLGVTKFSVKPFIAFSTEFILSFALMFVIISVATDSRAVGELAGIAIGSTVVICASVGGSLTGASMNLARSIGPALVSGQWDGFWVYLIAPVLGTVAGALTYEWIRCQKEVDGGHGCC